MLDYQSLGSGFDPRRQPGFTEAYVGQLLHPVSQVHRTSLLCWLPCLLGSIMCESDVKLFHSSIFWTPSPLYQLVGLSVVYAMDFRLAVWFSLVMSLLCLIDRIRSLD